MLDLPVLFAVFALFIFGVGPALLPISFGSPLRRVTVGIAASLVVLYLLSFGIYILNLPAATHWGLFIGAMAVAYWRRRRLLALWADTDVHKVALVWLAVTAWLLGWQFMVFSYSGSTWQGDWFEHFYRAKFFLKHWDVHYKFLGIYSISSRPPLVNIVTGVFQVLAGGKFHVYQAICVLLASLVVWPTCVLQQKFVRRGTPVRFEWATLLLMALPALVQNAAFTWTKLPTTFFILTGLVILSDLPAKFSTRLAGWLALTAGMLSHYSSGPWIIAIALAGALRNLSRWRELFTRQNAYIGLACVLLFGSWLAWSSLRLGFGETMGSNSTVTDGVGMTWQARLGNVVDNLYYTAVPVFFRRIDYGGYLPGSPAVRLRDEYFNAVQSSALMIAGVLGVFVAAGLLWSERKTLVWRSVLYWGTVIGVGVLLGIAVHTTVIEQGVGQICLLPFAFIVVAWLAARIPAAGFWRWALIPGLIADFTLGILLHFSLQTYWLPHFLYPDKEVTNLFQLFGFGAVSNFRARETVVNQPYLYDRVEAFPATLVLLCVAVALLIASFRASAGFKKSSG